MDTVFIHQIKAETLIGIFDWERQVKRQLFIDLTIAWDNEKAGKSDNIEDALNYHSVSVAVQNLCFESKFQLLESLAEAIWQLLAKDFAVEKAEIKITKPGAVANVKDLGVIIERSKK